MKDKKYIEKGTKIGTVIGGVSGMLGASSLGEMAAGGVAGGIGGAFAGATLGYGVKQLNNMSKGKGMQGSCGGTRKFNSKGYKKNYPQKKKDPAKGVMELF